MKIKLNNAIITPQKTQLLKNQQANPSFKALSATFSPNFATRIGIEHSKNATRANRFLERLQASILENEHISEIIPIKFSQSDNRERPIKITVPFYDIEADIQVDENVLGNILGRAIKKSKTIIQLRQHCADKSVALKISDKAKQSILSGSPEQNELMIEHIKNLVEIISEIKDRERYHWKLDEELNLNISDKKYPKITPNHKVFWQKDGQIRPKEEIGTAIKQGLRQIELESNAADFALLRRTRDTSESTKNMIRRLRDAFGELSISYD